MDRENSVSRRLHRVREPARYCGIGGSSKSSSSADNTTTNYDQRVVGGTGSTNVSASGSTVSVLDAGAVRESFGFARSVYSGTLSSLDRSMGLVAGAYSEAKAGEQKVLVAGGLIIVGIVALNAVKGRA